MSFMEKAELEQQLKPNLNYNDYVELLELIWNPLVEKGYSFIIKNENSRIIGVALNFDANDEPEVDISGPLSIIFEFLDFLEVPIKYDDFKHYSDVVKVSIAYMPLFVFFFFGFSISETVCQKTDPFCIHL